MKTHLAAAICGLLVAACEPTGPQTGGQTNWLRACKMDAECGALMCHCGTCTRTCDADASCADLPGASCIPAATAGAVALCGGHEPAQVALCLSRCDSDACPAGAACVAGVCQSTPEPTARVTVDVTRRYQTLVGFGAGIGYVDDEIVRHPQKAALYQVMFGDSGIDVLRLRNRYVSPTDADLSSISEIVDAATTGLGRVPTLLLNSASPPAALKANGATLCGGNPDTCTLTRNAQGGFDYAGLATHWRASLDAYASAGITPDFVGIQNNPNWVPEASSPLEACRFLPTEGTATVTLNGAQVQVQYPGLAEALAAVVGQLAGLASVPQITAPEVTGTASVADYAPALDFSIVGALSHHLYGMDPTAVDTDALVALGALGAQHQRPLFQTEMGSDGFGTAVLMHHALAEEGASLYLQNLYAASASALAGDPLALISLTTDGFSLELNYYVMRHYALHTDPGWVRVGATSDAEDLLATAWLSPQADQLTLVLVNAGSAEVDAELDLGADPPPSSDVTRTVFEGIERSAELGSLPSSGILRVPGRAIVTVALR